MTIRSETTTGGERFVIDSVVAGKRKRAYFKTAEEAEQKMAEMEASLAKHGTSIGLISPAERAELILAFERGKEGKFSVLQAVDYYSNYINNAPLTEKFSEAVNLFLKQRKKELAHGSYKNLKSIIRRWESDTDVELVVELTRPLIEEWLEGLTSRYGGKPARARTKNGYLAEIRNFLNWAKENYIVPENIGDKVSTYKPSVEELAEVENEESILTPKDVQKIMDWIVANRPDMTPRVAALFFAGLRPDREAALFQQAHVDFDENLLFVPASHAKDRQRRYIEMNPTLVAWLKWAKDHPTPVINWDNGWTEAKKVVGDWPHDAARHCFASYSLPVDGIQSTTANLGHGDYEMLFKHYRTVVKRKAADQFWGIMPPRRGQKSFTCQP